MPIIRPPVILIHGLWASPADWGNFSPLFSNAGLATVDSRFVLDLVDYSEPPKDENDQPITIVSSTPDYSSLPAGQGTSVLLNAQANSLGFQFNAPAVLRQITDWIGQFKAGANTQSDSVAAVQADIVAHSMGGNITRTLPLQQSALQVDPSKNFLSVLNFDQGVVHKLITIDTPHLGSPLATQLLQSQNSCVANLLALANKPAFGSVQALTSTGSFTVSGAVGDLVDSPQSQALKNTNNPSQPSIPVRTALIAGTANGTNWSTLATDGTATFIRATCGTAASNPLANNLTPDAWPSIFGDQSDAIVGLNSQLDGLNADPGSVFDGNVHSPGIEKLGFAGPSVTDSGPAPMQVITLLNTPVASALFHRLNP